MEKLIERFIRYACIDTQSDENSSACPSTRGQLELGDLLINELKEIGMSDIERDANGYIMATLPANTDEKAPVIGFIAHLDTSPDYSGKDVKPQIHEFTGSDIIINEKENIVLSPSQFPVLNEYTGQQIITSDGTTLLGADDKAGVAEIMTAMEHLIKNPGVKHGRIRVAFTPDEELGRGADRFDVAAFGSDFAYTIDGGGIGEIEYENFNAAKAKVTVSGLNVHPGYAKGKMKNAVLMAMELNQMLPSFDVPQNTDNYEGFFHLNEMQGNVSETIMHYIIRDHDPKKFQFKKSLILKTAELLNIKYGEGTVNIDLKDQYFNMREKIEPVYGIIELARKAIEKAGVVPKTIPIRGGTDGSRLSYMGLPCPNLFGGGHNFHSRFEFIPVKSMEKAAAAIVNICSQAVNSGL